MTSRVASRTAAKKAPAATSRSSAKAGAAKAAEAKPAAKKTAPKAAAGKAPASKAPGSNATAKKAAPKPAPAKPAANQSAPAKAAANQSAPAKAAAKKPAAKKTVEVKAPAKPAKPEPAAPRRKPQQGHVALVAAGPGDPDLVTLRAAALLASADLIVTDTAALVVAETLAGPTTEVRAAADENGIPLDQAARSALVVEAAREGRKVVRLMSGDPVLDGSLHTEASSLRRAHIAFEVAPGVSEVTGVPAYAGFSLTGGRTRQVRLVDAHDTDLPWGDLVGARTTLVFLNGADKAAEIAERLMAAGAGEDTPIAVTRRGTTVDQRTVVSTLAEIGAVAKSTRQAGPGLVVVGDVVGQRDKLDWFEVKSLFGWRVLIPRTQDNAAAVVDLLRGHGAVPIEVPTISVEPPRTPQQIDRAIHGLVSGRYEWIGFTSVNAVRAIREKLQEYGLDARSFAGLKVAAVGESTVASLVEFGVRPDIVPSGDQTTSALLEEWPAYDSLLDPINRVFLPRADIATDTLAAGLSELGWEVEDVTAYRTVRAAPPPAETREAIKTGGFDAVLFTSSSTVRNLVGIAGKPHVSTVVACIGPQTAKAAEEHGLRVDVLADAATVPGLVEALAAHGESLRQVAIETGEGTWRPSRRRPTARRKAT